MAPLRVLCRGWEAAGVRSASAAQLGCVGAASGHSTDGALCLLFLQRDEQDASRNKRRLHAHLHRLQQEKAHQGRSKEGGRLTAEERAILIAGSKPSVTATRTKGGGPGLALGELAGAPREQRTRGG